MGLIIKQWGLTIEQSAFTIKPATTGGFIQKESRFDKQNSGQPSQIVMFMVEAKKNSVKAIQETCEHSVSLVDTALAWKRDTHTMET